MTRKKTPVINNIVDAFKIMDMINELEQVGVTEIAQTLEIPKATIYRILKSLEAVNAVKQNKDTSYSLDRPRVAGPPLAQTTRKSTSAASSSTLSHQRYGTSSLGARPV